MTNLLGKPFLLFNTRFQIKEPFFTENTREVKIYCCGPTVHDVPHLGHARTFIFTDNLCRFLKHGLNYSVRYVMNITDCDNKIIEKGGLSIARKNEKIFFEVMAQLNVIKPDFTPRASEYWREAKNYVQDLREKGFVQLDHRFNIQSYFNQHETVFRQNQNREPPKEGFLVWKTNSCAGLETLSESGKPGWHMECTCMNAYFFGDSVDIHVGGIDLIFPHHENEIALGRVLFNNPNWVRYTLHTGHLEIEGCKMSKSKKNFVTLQDMLNKKYSPLAIRYLFMKHPYGKTMHFNEKEVEKAQKSLDLFMYHLKKLEDYLEVGKEEPQTPNWEEFHLFQNSLYNCLLDNLNVPDALQVLEDYVKKTLPAVKNKPWLQYCLRYVLEVTDKWFGLIPQDIKKSSHVLFPKIKEFRSQIRKEVFKQLELCDELRKELNSEGFIIEDEKQ